MGINLQLLQKHLKVKTITPTLIQKAYSSRIAEAAICTVISTSGRGYSIKLAQKLPTSLRHHEAMLTTRSGFQFIRKGKYKGVIVKLSLGTEQNGFGKWLHLHLY